MPIVYRSKTLIVKFYSTPRDLTRMSLTGKPDVLKRCDRVRWAILRTFRVSFEPASGIVVSPQTAMILAEARHASPGGGLNQERGNEVSTLR